VCCLFGYKVAYHVNLCSELLRCNVTSFTSKVSKCSNNTGKCTYNLTSRCVPEGIVDEEKQYVLHTPSVCVCLALAIQHANRIPNIIFSSVACLTVPYFSHYLLNGTIIGKSYSTLNICFDFLYSCCWKHFSF
jgi:hypothetical protein